VIFQTHPGQESGNVTLAQRTGSGCYIPDVDALVQAVGARPQELPTGSAMQANWWGGAAQRVAAHLLTAQREQRTEPAAAPGQLWSRDAEPALSGHVIHNPISGERIVIRETGAQTGGRLLSFDLFLPPGGHVPARHVHPVQEEQFTVVAGRMRFRVGRHRTILANPGETVVVPPGTAHWFGNDGAGVSHARVEVRPALRMEELFESAAAMDVVGHLPGTRRPRLFDLALFMIEFQRELAVPDLPPNLVRAFLAPLAWLARRRGRRVIPG
jgi:quercetin dioxygenase-like cupin family protein